MKKKYFLIVGILLLLFVGGYFFVMQKYSYNSTKNIVEKKNNQISQVINKSYNTEKSNAFVSQKNSQTHNDFQKKDSLNHYLFYKEFKNKLKDEQLLYLNNNIVYTIEKDENCEIYQNGLALMRMYEFSNGKLSIKKSINVECNKTRFHFFLNNNFIETYSGEGSSNTFKFFNQNLDEINELNLKNNSESLVLIKTKGNNAVFIYDDSLSKLKKVSIINSTGEIIKTFNLEYQNIVDFDIYDNKLVLSVFDESLMEFKLIIKSITSEEIQSIFMKESIKKIELINKNKILINTVDDIIIIDLNNLERKINLKSNHFFQNKKFGFVKKISNTSIAVIFYELDSYKSYKNIEYYELDFNFKILNRVQIGNINGDFDFEINGHEILIITATGTFKKNLIEK